MRLLKLVIIAFVVVNLASCAATFVDKSITSQSVDDIAILEHEDPIHGGIVIERIDGKWRGNGIIHEYKLAPGTHTIGVMINRAFYASTQQNATFTVLAGRRYVIRGYTEDDNAARKEKIKWDFQIIDKATGARVDVESKSD